MGLLNLSTPEVIRQGGNWHRNPMGGKVAKTSKGPIPQSFWIRFWQIKGINTCNKIKSKQISEENATSSFNRGKC